MTNQQTRSWIFLAIALASESGAADHNSIATIADSINHAVPTQNELQTSILWLAEKGLITKKENTYSLTKQGNAIYSEASKKTAILSKIWINLEQKLNAYA